MSKLGNVADGGGWRYVGRQQGLKHRSVTAQRTGGRGYAGGAKAGTAFVHTVIDDQPGRLRGGPRVGLNGQAEVFEQF